MLHPWAHIYTDRLQSPPSTTAVSILLRRIEELESLVNKQNSNTTPIPMATDIPSHHTEISLPQLDQNDSISFLASIMDPSNVFPSTFPVTIPPALEYSDLYSLPLNRDETENKPLTIPIGYLTPTSSPFSLEPIQKLIGEYLEAFFSRSSLPASSCLLS